MEPAIRVREVTKTYAEGGAGVPALRGVDLDVERGQVLLLMGPSGSGKTTLLSIMGCILRPSSGSVRIGGREVSRLSEKQLPAVRLEQVGFVFQSFNLFSTLTARENVELVLDLHGVRGAAARRQAGELLERVGLADKCDALPGDLSGGQKQRVAIARALAGRSNILLADEPTAALDSRTGRSVMDTIQTLAHQDDRAVVIVTHDPRIFEYADRIVHIEDGMITDRPTPAEESP
jgi:putative ABC transport system ATP-binding protein